MANIVICADGTWNRPEEDIEKDHPSNVLKLARAVCPIGEGIRQHVFYDWGLGSYHDKILAGASGRGIHKNILDAYRYIVQNYTPGDALYFFGFSRGAYTVRALSGLINNCGILKRPDARLIAQAWQIYKHPDKHNHPEGKNAVAFRNNYCHPDRTVQFVGVWDTVGALGVPFSLMGLFNSHDEFYDTKMGPNIRIARHALAIDEQREDFVPTLWTPRDKVDLKQVWFAGVHADIGGSYPPDKDSGLVASDIPLGWMLDEAALAGLIIEPHIRQSLTDGVRARIHRSRRHIYRLRKPLQRELVVAGKPTTIDPSVRLRYEIDSSYRPLRLKALLETTSWDQLLAGAAYELCTTDNPSTAGASTN